MAIEVKFANEHPLETMPEAVAGHVEAGRIYVKANGSLGPHMAEDSFATIEALAAERDTLAAQLADLRPTEGAPDEAEELARRFHFGEWSGQEELGEMLTDASSLLRGLASELRGYRKAVTWGVDTVAEGYRLEVEKLRGDIGALEAANDELRCVQLPRLETLAAKVNAIRNSIVGAQAVNWSEHIYPLVAALNDAGIGGESYDVARVSVGALVDRVRELEERDAAARAYEYGSFRAVQIVIGSWRVQQRYDDSEGPYWGGTTMTVEELGMVKDAAIAKAKALAAGEVKP